MLVTLVVRKSDADSVLKEINYMVCLSTQISETCCWFVVGSSAESQKPQYIWNKLKASLFLTRPLKNKKKIKIRHI